MKSRSPSFWLNTCIIGFMIVLGLVYLFQPTAFERWPWPWFLIFFCPLLMYFMGHGKHSKHEAPDKKQADDEDHIHE
jgi:cell division protein FtsW (lipid II flippase)